MADKYMNLSFSCRMHGCQYELLRAQVEALKADAERYRWLRDMASPAEIANIESWLYEMPSELDAAIDKALRGEGE